MGIFKYLLILFLLIAWISFSNASETKKIEKEWKDNYQRAERLYTEGKLKEAMDISHEAVNTAKDVFGVKDPRYALSLDLRGRLLANLGQYSEAEILYKRAEAILIENYGQYISDFRDLYHPDIAVVLSNRADLYRLLGRHEEAESFYIWVLHIREKTLGEGHLNMAETYYKLAEIQRHDGRFEEAENNYRASIDIMNKTLGIRHPYFVRALTGLAALFHTQKRYKEADIFFWRALSAAEETSGKSAAEAVIIRKNLKRLYEDRGNYLDASRLEREIN